MTGQLAVRPKSLKGKAVAILDRDSIKRYLSQVQIDYEPPPRAPPRSAQESFDFDQKPTIRMKRLSSTSTKPTIETTQDGGQNP